MRKLAVLACVCSALWAANADADTTYAVTTAGGYGGSPVVVSFYTGPICGNPKTALYTTISEPSQAEPAARAQACATLAQRQQREAMNSAQACVTQTSNSYTQDCGTVCGYGGSCQTVYANACVITIKPATGCSDTAFDGNPYASPPTSNCGYVNEHWNVPAGAAVFYRFPSENTPIGPIIDSIGEVYNHVSLSLSSGTNVANGSNGLLLHATMTPPPSSDISDFCSWPLSKSALRAGYPGVELLNGGGAYARGMSYHYGGQVTRNGETLDGTTYYKAASAEYVDALVDWANAMPKVVTASRSGIATDTFQRPLRNGSPMTYGLYQFMNIEQTHLVNSSSSRNGVVCSTLMAYAQAQATNSRGSPTTMVPYTYGHDALVSAAESARDYIYGQCDREVGFWGKSLYGAICGVDPCVQVVNQVMNCFAKPDDSCGLSSNYWSAVVNAPGSSAWTISPDRVFGRLDTESDKSRSIWSGPATQVYWNQDGSSYGCWR